MLTVGSLFTGIGGFDLAFQRQGAETLWMCEQDPFCQWVLRKHWPTVTIYPSVQRLHDPPSVDVLCGGFPCQDISVAKTHRGAGLDGKRSGLWSEFARLIRDLRPSYVVAENSPQITSRGLDRVLCDLAACGYDAEWNCIPAAAIGALHVRERIWIVAYPSRTGLDGSRSTHELLNSTEWERWRTYSRECAWWAVEPGLSRVADGFPYRLDADWHYRVRATGNALVPQVAEWIAKQVVRDSLSRGIS